jgi:hypothetical protein
VISAVIGGIATLLAFYLRLPRCPVELSVVGVEPSSLIYFGEKKAMQVTLRVRRLDSVFAYDIPSFEAKVGGRWIEFQRVAGFPGTVGGGMRVGTEPEETLVMPEGTEACRVQLRYHAGTWKRRFIESIGPIGRSWVAKSRWLHKLVWPDPNESMPWQPPKTNTVEIMIPRSDRKSGALLPSAHNQGAASNPAIMLWLQS